MTTFFLHEQRYRTTTPLADRQITICGAGALGANLAESLARMGCGRLRVLDRDRVEVHNLSTQPWTQQDIGAPKARVLASALYRAVGARVEPHMVAVTDANAAQLLTGSAVVVDAFDNILARRAVQQTTAALGIPCLHVALGDDGKYGCGLWDMGYVLPIERGGRDTCDYPLTRSLALLVAAAGAEVLVRHLLDGSKEGFDLTLGDLALRRVVSVYPATML